MLGLVVSLRRLGVEQVALCLDGVRRPRRDLPGCLRFRCGVAVSEKDPACPECLRPAWLAGDGMAAGLPFNMW